MIIELNKHYINAIGEVIYIAEHKRALLYPFRDAEDKGYSIDGKYINRFTDNDYDLICECVPSILNKYMDKDITQKKFIQKHIDYYTKSKV